jgi:adenylate cyclase class IV
MLDNSIEVELKFLLSQEEEIKLLDGASWIQTREFTDIYYDTKDYSLSSNDIWLRSRNGKFILKSPLACTSQALKTQANAPKREIEDESCIRQMLSLQKGDKLHEDLIQANILPLYTFKNHRRSYTKDGFVIDLDQAIFDDFTYETCEIETLVRDQSGIEKALQRIIAFAESHGLSVKPVEGRLIEYLRRHHPDHYAILKQCK